MTLVTSNVSPFSGLNPHTTNRTCLPLKKGSRQSLPERLVSGLTSLPPRNPSRFPSRKDHLSRRLCFRDYPLFHFLFTEQIPSCSTTGYTTSSTSLSLALSPPPSPVRPRSNESRDVWFPSCGRWRDTRTF